MIKKSIHVMLIEDHPEYRETLEFILRKDPSIHLTSQFGNAEHALRNLKNAPVDKHPDILLLDLNLPGMPGLEAMTWFKEYAPKMKIIILSQSDHEQDVLRAIKQGAHGYLLKSCAKQEIIQGIHSVHSGGATLEPHLASFILNTLQKQLEERPASSPPTLSKREHEILSLIAQGLTQKEISDHLKISTYTVTDHLKHTYEKLNVANAPQAISKAYEQGIFNTKEKRR